MTRVAINGLGRMGRLVLRAGWDDDELEFVRFNELVADAATSAHLLEFDSLHGRWGKHPTADGESITIDARRVPHSRAPSPAEIDWGDSPPDIVVECTGQFKTPESLAPYFDHGVRKVVVAAPVKEGALNIVMGVNHAQYDPRRHHLVTAASCTTNCLAPVVKVIRDSVGIRHGVITTIHDVTNTQRVVDAPHPDLRRARSCLTSLIPTSTGSATAITMIYPELAGKLNGIAVRVPLLNASLTDCVFEVERPTTVKEINERLKAAAESSPLAGVLGFEERPLVSVDFLGDPRSAVIDGPSTMVVDGTQVKILAWYDNEFGYVHRLVELTKMVARGLDGVQP
ncbi:MAG: ArsJ-associated glyceraldehyde-3-phosphate dehydrogenase [Myxococcota bacterium]